MAKKKVIVKFCPNCGRLVEARDYLSLRALVLGIEGNPNPIGDRILCARCNYGGLPLEVDAEEYTRKDFSKWEMLAPPVQGVPKYRNFARWIIFICAALLTIALTPILTPCITLPFFAVAVIWFFRNP